MKRLIDDNRIRYMQDDRTVAEITEDIREDTVVVSLAGTFNTALANDVLDELIALITAGRGIELNLKDAEYLSSSVQIVFLSLENKLESAGKTLRLTNVPGPVYEGFRKSGMHELLEIELEKQTDDL